MKPLSRGPRRPGVDDQFERAGLLDRQIGRPFTVENPACINSHLAKVASAASSITHQAAGHNVLAKLKDGRDAMANRKVSKLRGPGNEKSFGADHEGFRSQFPEIREDRVEITFGRGMHAVQ